MKFIKSILAVAAAVFIGSSAWAKADKYEDTVSVDAQKTVTKNTWDKHTKGTGFTWKKSGGDENIATCTVGSYNSKSQGVTVTFTGVKAGTTIWTIAAEQQKEDTDTWVYTVTVAGGSTVIEKTVEVGKTINFNSTAKITASYFYQFIIDGSSTAVTRTPTSVTKNGGSAANVALSLTGVSATTSPVTMKLRQKQWENYGNWSDVETYSVTVTKATENKTSEVSYVAGSGAQTLTPPSQFTQSCTWSATSDKTGVATVSVNNSGTATKNPSISISPVSAGTATITVKNTSNTTSYDYTWTVTVTVTEAPTAYNYKDYTILASGATQIAAPQGSDDLILKFTESGTMNVPVDLIANVLVVGGGGSGAAGRSGSSHTYCGNGGGGGKGSLSPETLDAGDYVITVGNGGKGLQNEDSWQGETYKDGNPGDYSSIIGGREFPGLQADGGTAGSGGAEGSAADGTGGYNTEHDITGDPVLYGANGKGASQDTAQPGVNGGGGQGSYNGKTSADGGSGVVIVRFTGVVKQRDPIAVPTAAQNLVYGYTNQVGVAEGEGYVLTGVSVTNEVGNYVAIATPDEDHCWIGGSIGSTNIAWSIARAQATVTVVSTNKLVGAEEPIYQTKNEGFIAEDSTELTWTAFRTNASETVGTYDVLVAGEEFQGGYQISYNKGTLTILAGVMIVNGKPYLDVAAAFAALKAGGNAIFNEEVTYDAFTFAQGTTMTVADGAWFVTNDLTIAETTVTNDISVAQKLTLTGNVTVGDDDHEAILAFAEIDNKDGAYKLTLTTNGVVQSAKALDIDAIFTEAPEFFQITETQIDGGFEYKLEALNVVEVPTAVDGLVYDGTEQTGVEEGEGYTLEDNTATDAGSYTATATLADGYIWADGKTEQKTIGWSIAKAQVTVTADNADKLVGTDDPEFTATVKGLFGDDEIDYEVARTNKSEAVGTYDLVVTGDAEQGSYDVTYVDGTFEIRAGKVTVNGKGYDTVAEAYIALVDAAKSGKATAVFNEAVANFNGYSFAKGGTLTVEEDGLWTVTGDVTAAMIEKEKTVTVVDSTLTLGGDIYVGNRADWPTEVTSSNVVLAANVTVGAATEGFKPVGIATLAFEEINVNGHKLTLTTNGVVQSVAQLTIDDVFAKVDHFGVVEKAITGGFEYTLEASEFEVKYYDNDGITVVHTDTATILNYMTDLHIWNGDRKGLELVGYTREDKVTPLDVSDAALRAYVKDEADKPGCDGEVKVFGTWEKPTITIKIVTGEGVDDVQTNGVSVVGDLELSAETTTVALELVKDGLTIPVYKVITNDVTNVTQRVATYAVVEGLTYTFIAEEAEDDDPTVTPTDTKKAIIDAIDEENKAVVAPKIDAVVDTAEPPAAGKVSAKEMATWITEKEIQSVDMKDSNYLAASVNLDTSAPITDAAEVKFVEVEEDTSTGFTFDFELKLSGEETPEELEVEAAKLAGYIQTTGDLGTDFEVIGDTKRVTIDPDTGKVTITPDPTKSAEFFKIVIPKDPGAK